MGRRWPHKFAGAVLACSIHGNASAQPVAVTDDSGARVELAAPARRIITLAPHATEMLFEVGAGAHIVGTVEYSDYPDAALKIPRVGSYPQIDMERLVALHPDLVVVWGSGNAGSLMPRLAALKIPAYMTEPHTLEDVAQSMEKLGLLAGRGAEAQAVGRAFRARRDALAARYGGRARVRVFYEIWNRPLTTVNGRHLISHVLALCGGENVFANATSIAPAVGEEAVLAANPEAIVASNDNPKRTALLDDWKRWTMLTAVARGNLFDIPPELMQRHSPRILEGAAQLCDYLETVRRRRPAAAG
ncbi:MAG: cobalamin-binding protein [Rhodocyclaceae bacterium]|nr:cobalamin-binding protein [Rhodocyclaceae bacterium]